MKYNYDSYMLYQTGKIIRNVVRAKVTMNQPVDIDILKSAVNTATDRYPYFKKRVTVNEDGAYILEDNARPVVVIPTRQKAPAIGCEEVNGHLLYVDTEGHDIYFCISHSLAGGKGIQPWIMTCIYQYVTDKFHVMVNAPGIRKPGSNFLPTERTEPAYDLLPEEEPIYRFRGGKAAALLMDYINGFVNPLMKKEEYYLFTFQQSEIMKFSKSNDSSVASLFAVLMFQAMNRVLPKSASLIRATLAHNPCASLGIPDSHCHFLSHIYVDYKRELAAYDLEKLGTITRAQMILQSDETCSAVAVRKTLETIEKIDRSKGLKKKRNCARKNDPGLGKDAVRGTYNINYTGCLDWGELANYVKSFVFIVDGHMLSEISAIGDRIFFAPMTLVNAEKYIKAFSAVLNELGIHYTVEGPFPKNLPYQEIPR